MSSIFFQISDNEYLEASRIHSHKKEYALRLVTFKNGIPEFVYLPDVTMDELATILTIFRARMISGVNNYRTMYNQWYNTLV